MQPSFASILDACAELTSSTYAEQVHNFVGRSFASFTSGASFARGGEELSLEKLLTRMPVSVFLVELDGSTSQIIAMLLWKCGYRGVGGLKMMYPSRIDLTTSTSSLMPCYKPKKCW